MSGTALRPRKRSSGHARRPRKPMRLQVARRLPSASRLIAIGLFATLLAGLVVVVNGPWLRVGRIAHAGGQYTSAAALDELLATYRGASLLALDSAGLGERLRELPAVAEARVETVLPDELRVSVVEKAPAFTWITRAARLVGAADGMLIGELPREGDLPAELAQLPVIDDQRPASRRMATGDQVPAAELRVALRLLALDPPLLGSVGARFAVRVHAEYGFILVSRDPEWRAALGFYQLDPREDAAAADARLDAQVAAIRTLFAEKGEAAVSWVDARNPGRVYWTP